MRPTRYLSVKKGAGRAVGIFSTDTETDGGTKPFLWGLEAVSAAMERGPRRNAEIRTDACSGERRILMLVPTVECTNGRAVRSPDSHLVLRLTLSLAQGSCPSGRTASSFSLTDGLR